MNPGKLLYTMFVVARRLMPFAELGNLFPISNVSAFLSTHVRPSQVTVHGCKLFLNPADNVISGKLGAYNTWEEFETEVFIRSINNGDVVVDIGANIGYYALIASKRVGDTGTVFAFEPDPTNFAFLKKNVEANGLKNLVLERKAVSNSTSRVRLFLSDNNPGDHRIYDSPKGHKRIEVDSVRLDDYFKKHDKRVDVIKMDIQGAEGTALAGMSSLLKETGIRIFTEFRPAALRECGTPPWHFARLLSDFGFTLYEIHEHVRKLIRTDAEELVKTYDRGNNRQINLLCVRDQGPVPH